MSFELAAALLATLWFGVLILCAAINESGARRDRKRLVQRRRELEFSPCWERNDD